MSDTLSLYDTGLNRLLERLGKEHPHYASALVYQQQLQENIAKARRLSVQAAGAVLQKRAPQQKYLAELRQILSERFDEGELRTLCFDLGVGYGNLPGEGKVNKARELISYLGRRDLIPKLVEIGQQLRPDISWENMPGATGYTGSDELEHERAQIIDALNRLALKELGVSFDDLCVAVSRIQVILEGGISDFTNERREILRDVLASVLRVEPSDIRILRVQPGSIRVIVEVPEEALTRLNSLSRDDISMLVSIGVQTVEGHTMGTLDFRRQLSQRVDDLGRDRPDRGFPRIPVPWWRSRKVWVRIIIAVIVLAGVFIPIVLTRHDGSVGFGYLVRVQVKDTGECIQDAKVIIEVPREPPLDETTDVNGIAVIAIDSSHAGQRGKLIVEASGYKKYEQNIILVTDALPDVVQLEPAP